MGKIIVVCPIITLGDSDHVSSVTEEGTRKCDSCVLDRATSEPNAEPGLKRMSSSPPLWIQPVDEKAFS